MFLQVIQLVLTSLVGLFGVAAALNGYLYKPINPLFRAGMIVGGLCMMIPGTMTDIVGLVILGAIIVLQRGGVKKAA